MGNVVRNKRSSIFGDFLCSFIVSDKLIHSLKYKKKFWFVLVRSLLPDEDNENLDGKNILKEAYLIIHDSMFSTYGKKSADRLFNY